MPVQPEESDKRSASSQWDLLTHQHDDDDYDSDWNNPYTHQAVAPPVGIPEVPVIRDEPDIVIACAIRS